MRSHLKVYFSFEEDTQALNDGERGRLLLAMVRYARDGAEINLTGNERFLWPVFKAQIDRDIETYDIKVNNGSKGGRPKNQPEPNETENNLTKPKKTKANRAESEKTETPKIEDRRLKIKDRYIDDDDDDDDDNYAREGEPEDLTEELERREAIGAAIEAQYGRKATPAEGSQISLRAKLLGQTPEMAALAIKIAAENGARNVIKYVTRIFDTWDFEHVKTPEEAEELARMRSEATGGLYALDSHEDAERMREARERRKAEHKEG